MQKNSAIAVNMNFITALLWWKKYNVMCMPIALQRRRAGILIFYPVFSLRPDLCIFNFLNRKTMLPIGDDDSDRKITPIVNYILIAANILVFIFLEGMGSNEHFTYAFSTVPAEILTGHDIATHGLQPTPVPVYFTLLTSMFMHGSWAHLGGNMLFL